MSFGSFCVLKHLVIFVAVIIKSADLGMAALLDLCCPFNVGGTHSVCLFVYLFLVSPTRDIIIKKVKIIKGKDNNFIALSK